MRPWAQKQKMNIKTAFIESWCCPRRAEMQHSLHFPFLSVRISVPKLLLPAYLIVLKLYSRKHKCMVPLFMISVLLRILKRTQIWTDATPHTYRMYFWSRLTPQSPWVKPSFKNQEVTPWWRHLLLTYSVWTSVMLLRLIGTKRNRLVLKDRRSSQINRRLLKSGSWIDCNLQLQQ